MQDTIKKEMLSRKEKIISKLPKEEQKKEEPKEGEAQPKTEEQK